MRLFQPHFSIVNAFVVTDSSPNANLKFRVHEAEWINNLFLKGPSGGTSRFINSITELYPTPNEAVLKKVGLCKESFELLELGQCRGSARNLSPIQITVLQKRASPRFTATRLFQQGCFMLWQGARPSRCFGRGRG